MNRTVLGTVLGAVLLGLSKSKGSSARRTPFSRDDFRSKNTYWYFEIPIEPSGYNIGQNQEVIDALTNFSNMELSDFDKVFKKNTELYNGMVDSLIEYYEEDAYGISHDTKWLDHYTWLQYFEEQLNYIPEYTLRFVPFLDMAEEAIEKEDEEHRELMQERFEEYDFISPSYGNSDFLHAPSLEDTKFSQKFDINDYEFVVGKVDLNFRGLDLYVYYRQKDGGLKAFPFWGVPSFVFRVVIARTLRDLGLNMSATHIYNALMPIYIKEGNEDFFMPNREYKSKLRKS
tara:strand:- start:46 stop:906 length:861 start_codon:yes stop_codon:yes gene_type:complete